MPRHLATSGFARLADAPSLAQAHAWAGALEAADIPTHVEEDNLADSFAMSQKLMGSLPIRVLVPAERLEEARLVLQGLSQPRPVIDEEDDSALAVMAATRRDRSVVMAAVLIAIFFGGPLVGYWLFWGPLSRLFGG